MPREPVKRGSLARSRANAPPPIELVLYVSPLSRYAQTAQRNCEDLLARFDRTRVKFEVCDVSRNPERGDEDSVCYTPMLVKRAPLPRTYVLGDLSNTDALIGLLQSCGLDLLR